MFGDSYGDTSYNALQEVFQMDSSDYKAKNAEYQIGVQLVKDSAEVSMTNGTMKFQTEISVWKPNGAKMNHPRKFVVDLVASMKPVMEESVLTADLSNIKATGIQLIGDIDITLTADQKTQYLTYAQMFLQMKKSSLGKHLQDMKYDLATFDPLSSLHATVTKKNYAVQVVDGVLNFDITSDSFPAPKQVARDIKTQSYRGLNMETYERVSNQLVKGVNAQDKTVIAQIDQDETNFFWVTPKQSLAKMTSYQNNQVTLFQMQ